MVVKLMHLFKKKRNKVDTVPINEIKILNIDGIEYILFVSYDKKVNDIGFMLPLKVLEDNLGLFHKNKDNKKDITIRQPFNGVV